MDTNSGAHHKSVGRLDVGREQATMYVVRPSLASTSHYAYHSSPMRVNGLGSSPRKICIWNYGKAGLEEGSKEGILIEYWVLSGGKGGEEWSFCLDFICGFAGGRRIRGGEEKSGFQSIGAVNFFTRHYK